MCTFCYLVQAERIGKCIQAWSNQSRKDEIVAKIQLQGTEFNKQLDGSRGLELEGKRRQAFQYNNIVFNSFKIVQHKWKLSLALGSKRNCR